CGLFGNYETVLPAVRASGRMLEAAEAGELTGDEGSSLAIRETEIARYQTLREAPYFLKAYLEEGERYEEWARLMGCELQEAGGMFAFGGIRSSLKCRYLLYSNPFLLWLRNREDLCGPVGDFALDVVNRAVAVAPDAATRGVAEFARSAIEFTRFVELAHQA